MAGCFFDFLIWLYIYFISDEQKFKQQVQRMISFKIISQEVYTNLQKLSEVDPSEKTLLQKHNNELLEKIGQMKELSQNSELQLQNERLRNNQLSAHLQSIQNQIQQITTWLASYIQNGQTLNRPNNKQNKQNYVFEQKNNLEDLCTTLLAKINALGQEIISQKQKNKKLLENQQVIQSHFTQLDSIIQTLNSQKQKLQQSLQQKYATIQSLNLELQQKSNLVQKVVTEYDKCKEEKLSCEKEIQEFKKSPIPKLEEKIEAQETWITQLTKTINELRQRCVQLEMDRPETSLPSIFKPKLKSEQAERMKYLSICKQLVQQFNSKLIKIQQQKKSMESKYQCIKLKLNDYQYKEFKYKDKIGLYMQKIEKFEQLTQRQQSQMEKLIFEFDEELNNVIRMKQEEVKTKFQEEIEKYQQELQKLKEEQDNGKKQQFLQVNGSSMMKGSMMKGSMIKGSIMKASTYRDEFESQMLALQLEETERQLKNKSQELQNAMKSISKIRKQLQKYKKSKHSYKVKSIQLQKLCYTNSLQIRRYKSFVQQLYQELEIKSSENQILRNNLKSNFSFTHRSNGNSRLGNADEFCENLSAKVSSNNNVSGDRRSGSDHFEYQVSEIDTDLQKRNQLIMNQILIGKRIPVNLMKYNQSFNPPAFPSRASQLTDPEIRSGNWQGDIDDSINSISVSQISSHSQVKSIPDNSLNSLTSMNSINSSSPNNSSSSKNSYQSYGINQLYMDKNIGSGKKFLLHKNSVQSNNQ